MAGLRDQVVSDAAAFVAAADLGELVTYRPKAGGTLSIYALVLRAEPDQRSETARARFQSATVFVRNHATLGVTNPTEHGDRVDVVLRTGAVAVTCRVTSVRAGDEGMWELEVTA